MRTKNANRRRRVAQSIIPEYAQAASVALILALIVALVGIPSVVVAAQAEDEPSSFPSQAAAIDYAVAKEQARREAAAGEPTSFSSQAAAIDYAVAKEQARRQAAAASEPISFSSQAEAIDYAVAKEQARREAASGEPTSFSSQAAAIDYAVAKNRLERGIDANATCSLPDDALTANPELRYLGSLESC